MTSKFKNYLLAVNANWPAITVSAILEPNPVRSDSSYMSAWSSITFQDYSVSDYDVLTLMDSKMNIVAYGTVKKSNGNSYLFRL